MNPKPYNYEVDAEYDPENPPGQKITDAKPLGYSKAMLPHPPNAGNPNPVYQLNNLNQRQIELRVRSIFLIYNLLQKYAPVNVQLLNCLRKYFGLARVIMVNFSKMYYCIYKRKVLYTFYKLIINTHHFPLFFKKVETVQHGATVW